MKHEDPFETLCKVGASLSSHVLHILKQVGYTSFRGISQIDSTQIRRIESYVQNTMASHSNLVDMTDEENKKNVRCSVLEKSPKFVFFVGKEDEISAAANIAATYVKEFDKTIHVSYPLGGKRRKLSQPVSSSTSASTDQTIAGSSTTNDSSGSIQTSKKNLK